MKKLILALVAVCAMSAPAFAICTTVSVPATNTSTQVLAALDLGSNGRKIIYCGSPSSCAVYCDIGTTAAAFQGFLCSPGDEFNTPLVQPVQQEAKTFPIVPNGAVNCAVPANMGCQAQNVSICDY